MTFSLGAEILWIKDLYFSWKQRLSSNVFMMDLFLANTKLLLHKTLTNRQESWIIVMFLSAVLTPKLDGLRGEYVFIFSVNYSKVYMYKHLTAKRN